MKKSKRQKYFIDATNVSYWHDTSNPTLKYLLKLLNVLVFDKKETFFCIFDANTLHLIPEEEREIYTYLLSYNKHFHQVSGGKRADDYILSMADMYKANVISNDAYNDPKYSKYKWKDRSYKPTRLFMGEVITTLDSNHLMLFDLDINVIVENDIHGLYKQLEKYLNPPPKSYRGTIKYLSPKEGYGSIFYPQETAVYFKYDAKKEADLYEVEQSVTFSIQKNKNGEEEARNLQIYYANYEGTIAQYEEAKSSGYIFVEDLDRNVFFYKSYFANANTPNIKLNEKVTFELGKNSKGECAKNIKYVIDYEKQNEELNNKVKELNQLLKDAGQKINEQQLLIKNLKSQQQNKEKPRGASGNRNQASGNKKQSSGSNRNNNRNQNQDQQNQQHHKGKKTQGKNVVQHSQNRKNRRSNPKNKPEKQQEAQNNQPEKQTEEVVKQQPEVKKRSIKIVPSTRTLKEEKTKEESKKQTNEKQSKENQEQTPEAKNTKQTTTRKKPTTRRKKPANDKKTAAKRKKPVNRKTTNTKQQQNDEKKRVKWWNKLELPWKQAFNVVLGNGETVVTPSDEELTKILNLKTLSFYKSSKNKLSFKLQNLSGISELTQLTRLNVAENEITSLKGVEKLRKLQVLNCNKNNIDSLKGIHNLISLTQLQCNHNPLDIYDFNRLPRYLPKLAKLDARNTKLNETNKKKVAGMGIKSVQV